MRTFTLVLEDLRAREYRVTFARKVRGQFPKIEKIERKHIVFVDDEYGRKVQGYVWSLYRECCHGALNAHIKLAITQASAIISSAE